MNLLQILITLAVISGGTMFGFKDDINMVIIFGFIMVGLLIICVGINIQSSTDAIKENTSYLRKSQHERDFEESLYDSE